MTTTKEQPMKYTLLLILAIMSACCNCDKEAPPKPVYKKVIVMSTEDLNAYILALNQWKRLAPYDPTIPDSTRARVVKEIEVFIPQMLSRLKLDSVRVDTVKVKK